jgi:hypothetical protein
VQKNGATGFLSLTLRRLNYSLIVSKSMTSDERAQLLEDIRRSTTIREHIIQQAQSDKEFDITAAWEDLEELDNSINERIIKARMKYDL